MILVHRGIIIFSIVTHIKYIIILYNRHSNSVGISFTKKHIRRDYI